MPWRGKYASQIWSTARRRSTRERDASGQTGMDPVEGVLELPLRNGRVALVMNDLITNVPHQRGSGASCCDSPARRGARA